MKLSNVFLSTVMVAALFSCKKKEEPNNVITNTNGEIGIELTNYAGSSELVMGSGKYVTANGDTISISKFNYYISNVRFINADGNGYAEPNSYHLVQGDVGGSKHFHVETVPTGTYKSVSFLIGVDSTRNTSGAQEGALDPANGMFWSWSTGYIMAKMEGTSPQSGSTAKTFQYHIGGFSGANSGLRNVTLDLSANPLVVKTAKETTLAIKADALKWFSPNVIKLATTYDIMNVSANSKMIADNYANMFSVTEVINP